jgi:hypothetical protein
VKDVHYISPETGELEWKATLSILETVRHEGSHSVKQNLEYYNLNVIIAMGYRQPVNSSLQISYFLLPIQILNPSNSFWKMGPSILLTHVFSIPDQLDCKRYSGNSDTA